MFKQLAWCEMRIMSLRNSLARVLLLGALTVFAGGLPAWAQPHTPLSYHGGPVLGNFEIYPLYYGNWSSADIAAQQNYLTGLTAYLSGAGAPAGEQTMMQQYGVNRATVAADKSASAPAGTTGVSDTDLHTLIHANQASKNLPAYGSNTLIMVFLASGMTASSASNGSCAYHSSEGGATYYAVVPKDCALALVSAHEVFEAAADPGVGTSNAGWDEAVDGCTTIINLWFGQIPGAVDNTQSGTCSSTGYTGAFQYQGIAGPTQAVARMPGHLDVFWVGVDGSVQTNWWDAASGRWSTPFAIAPAGSALPGTVSVAARAPGHLDVFWVTPTGAVMTNYWDAGFRNGQWNAPFALTPPGSAVASQIAAVGRTVDHLDIFWVAQDGSVWTDAWDLQANNAQWAAPLQIGRKGSAVPGMVAAVTRAPGHLDVFWVAPDGSVTGFSWDANFNNGQWNGPEVVAWPNSALPGAITAMARRTDHLDVFWVGPDESIRTGSWDQNLNFGLGAWNAPVVVAGPGSALPGAITAVARTPDHLDAFWVAPDQSVGTNWWDASFNSGRWNTPFSISAPNAAMPSAFSAVGRLPGHLDVFWVADGSVASNWWDANFNSGRWNAQFSIGGPGSALAPDFSVPPRAGSQVASRNVNQLDLMYVAFNGAVIREFWSRFGSAGAPDTAAPAGSAPAIGVPTNTAPANGAVTVASRQQNHLDVFWTAPNGSVMSTWADSFVNNGSWNASFAVAPAGSASPGAMVAAATREANQIDVFWVSPAGAVMTASWDAFFNNARWYTPFAVAPASSAPAGAPVAVATRQANQIDIFWVATTGAVMIASWNGFWSTPFAIAPAGSAPPGAPVSVVARQANQLDVFWVTKNGTVMTNWWNSNVKDGIWSTPFAVASAGSAVAGSPVVAVAREANQLDVFWESPTRALMSNWWNLFANNGIWNMPYEIGTSESLEPGSPLAAIARQAGHIDVFWMAPGAIITGNSWDAFANNAQWSAPYPVLPAAPGSSGGGGGGGGGGGIGPPCGGPKGPPCHQ
jgi:hypothetical protein